MNDALHYNHKQLAECVKRTISEDLLTELQNKKPYDFEEGLYVADVTTPIETAIPMYFEIKMTNFDNVVGLESWCYFLKKDGYFNDLEDYEHFDGDLIIDFEKLKTIDFDGFVDCIVKNICKWDSKYWKHLKQKEL